MRPKSPPKNLGKVGTRYWKTVSGEFELSDDDMVLLASACEMLDRAEQAREIVTADGLVVKDRFGQTRPHPMLDVERQSRLAFCRIRRELALDVSPPESRPPLAAGYR